MERLTKEQLESYRDIYDRYEGIESSEFERICDELIEYKSLEEELGIDLITLFKALKDGIYYLEEENIFFSNDVNLWCGTSKNYYISGAGIYKKVKDYGKTWALTKEELEND